MERIAIVGAGAMGTLLGACLNSAGVKADLVDVNQKHIDAMNTNGARVVGKVNMTVPVTALSPDMMDGVYDVVFLLIKQTYNEASFPQLAPHLGGNSVVVTMQNGIPEKAVAEAFGEERTMGCAVTWAATMEGPGVTISTNDREMWNSNLGRLDGKITERGKRIQAILSNMCHTELSDNLAGIRWSKLIINSSFSGMSAALGYTFGQVLDDPEALYCAQKIARECIRVSRALGVSLHPIGEDGRLDALMDFDTEEERIATFRIYKRLFGTCYDGKASMLQDLERGMRTEICGINGVLSDYGKTVGVPTPFCDTVVEIVKEAERNKAVPTRAELARFKNLE